MCDVIAVHQSFHTSQTSLLQTKTLQVKIQYYKRKDQYGFGGRMYITGTAAKYIRQLTGRETLTPRNFIALKGLGHELVEVDQFIDYGK
jgi:hypothetical protein